MFVIHTNNFYIKALEKEDTEAQIVILLKAKEKKLAHG